MGGFLYLEIKYDLYIWNVSNFKNFISAGLVLIFLSMQLGSLHQLTHDDSTVPCKVCITAQQSQGLDYLLQNQVQIPNPTWIFISIEDQVEYAFAKAEPLSYYHLSRPPPVNC